MGKMGKEANWTFTNLFSHYSIIDRCGNWRSSLSMKEVSELDRYLNAPLVKRSSTSPDLDIL